MQTALKNIQKSEEYNQWFICGSFLMHHNQFQVWIYKEDGLCQHAPFSYNEGVHFYAKLYHV